MKKTLVALAALAATSAFAQVTISGNVDVSMGTKEVINGAGKTYAKSNGVQDGLHVPNRIFINVTEDLGGGTKFKFQNEHGISPTNTADWSTRQFNGAPTSIGIDKTAATTDTEIPMNGFQSNQTNRGTFVALENTGMGEIRAGYLVSHFYNLVAQSGYFLGSENYGALLQAHGMAAQGSTRGNGLQYISPKVGDFTFGLQKRYGAERTITADSAGAPFTSLKTETMSYRVDYANGPLNVGYVYGQLKADRQGVNGVVASDSIWGVTPSGTTVTTNGTQDNSASALNAAYTMGAWKAVAQINSATVNHSIDTLDRKFKSAQYGLQYTTGPVTVFGITGSGDVKKNDGTKVNDVKNTQYGVKYALSKRTTAYFMTGKSEDKAIAASDTTRAKEASMSGFGLSHAY